MLPVAAIKRRGKVPASVRQLHEVDEKSRSSASTLPAELSKTARELNSKMHESKLGSWDVRRVVGVVTDVVDVLASLRTSD